MNGQRIVRKYLERQTDEELHKLYEAAKNDTSVEGMVVFYLIVSELNKRKM